MKRTVTVSCTQDLSDSEWFRDKMVDAWVEYAAALEIGKAGNDSSETFTASNGLILLIKHTKEAAC